MIMKLTEHELIQSIQSGEISICVIGIGRIGLPTALSFANSGLPTVGVDINTELVENGSKFGWKEPLKNLSSPFNSQNNPQNVIIIVIPENSLFSLSNMVFPL